MSAFDIFRAILVPSARFLKCRLVDALPKIGGHPTAYLAKIRGMHGFQKREFISTFLITFYGAALIITMFTQISRITGSLHHPPPAEKPLNVGGVALSSVFRGFSGFSQSLDDFLAWGVGLSIQLFVNSIANVI